MALPCRRPFYGLEDRKLLIRGSKLIYIGAYDPIIIKIIHKETGLHNAVGMEKQIVITTFLSFRLRFFNFDGLLLIR